MPNHGTTDHDHNQLNNPHRHNCDDCKRRTGSTFGWNVYFDTSKIIDQRGEVSIYTPQTTPPQTRYACKICATTLYWTTEGWPGKTGISGGSFVGTTLPEPDISYQHKDLCRWITLPGDWEIKS